MTVVLNDKTLAVVISALGNAAAHWQNDMHSDKDTHAT